MKNDNTLNDKRRLFCCNFIKLGSIREAALKSGFSAAEALPEGMKCLESPVYRKLISKLRKLCSPTGSEIMTGLERLAFGSCNDAVYLVFSDELPPQEVIGKLDLFNVSEIKRVKGGGVEVKLFDRQKALEKMLEFVNSVDNSKNAAGLIEALTGGAKELCDNDD